MAAEFLIRVTPQPDGRYFATCEPTEATRGDSWLRGFGHGATPSEAVAEAMLHVHVDQVVSEGEEAS